MKKKISKFVIINCLVILFCCEQRQDNSSTLLLGNELPFVELLAPYDFESFGDYLIVADDAADEVLHIYSIASKRKLGSFGVKGNGPKEYGYLHFTSQSFQTNGEDFFWVVDWEKMTATLLSVQGILSENSYSGEHTVDFDPNMGFPKKVYFTNDSIIIGLPNYDADGRFFIATKSDVTWAPFLPQLPYEIPRNLRHIIYSTFFDVRNDSIFAAYTAFDGFDIYDMRGNILKSTVRQNDALLQPYDFTEGFFPENMLMYNEGVYALPSGELLLVKNNNRYEQWAEESSINLIPTTVEVFQDNLTKSSTYSLDFYAYSSIFNSERSSLITIRLIEDEREYMFYEHKLSLN